MKTKSVYFSAFREGNIIPANFETWLEDMALQGWKVEKIGQWSSLKMVFIESTPKKCRFVYDVNSFPTEEYKSIYEQFGWEYVGQMASANIWRQEYTNKRPESFSDMESIIPEEIGGGQFGHKLQSKMNDDSGDSFRKGGAIPVNSSFDNDKFSHYENSGGEHIPF
jgi:hypothetical protein